MKMKMKIKMKIQTLLLTTSILLVPLITQAKVSKIGNQLGVAQTINIPLRGNSMKKVLRRYGKAKRISWSKGKVTKKWPRITRWEYARFTVYFEKQRVIHTVVH